MSASAVAAAPDVARALQRAAVYRVLGEALAHPAPEGFEALALRAATAARLAGPGLRETLEGLAAAARDADGGTVAGEHAFLFDRNVRCSPYEGAYGTVAPLAGKAALLADVAGFYAAFGLQPTSIQPDTEDHIVAELEFMSALTLKEAWALGRSRPEAIDITRQAQRLFLTDHLGRWAEAFARDLAEATPLPYYAAAAALLARWVAMEVETLGATPSRVEGRLARDPLPEDTFTCPMAPEEGKGAG